MNIKEQCDTIGLAVIVEITGRQSRIWCTCIHTYLNEIRYMHVIEQCDAIDVAVIRGITSRQSRQCIQKYCLLHVPNTYGLLPHLLPVLYSLLADGWG